MRAALRPELPLILAAALAMGAPAAARPPAPRHDAAETTRQLQNAERDRAASLAAKKAAAERAAAARAEQHRLAADRVVAAARLRETETALQEAAAKMDGLARARAAAEAKLKARAADLAPLLPLIERLSLYPVETLLAVPGDPERTLTGVLVMKGLSRRLEQDAAALRAEQAELDRLTQEIAAQAPVLAKAQQAQAAQAAELDRQIAASRQVEKAAEDAAAEAERQAAGDAARANTLRGVLARIEADRRAAEARAQEEAARAEQQKKASEADAARQRQLALARPAGPGAGDAGLAGPAPVAGQVVRAFGDPTDAGPANGISYRAAPSARVTAPCSGRVVFAGPFRSYGLLLILDCGGGYHFVLAGLDRLDVQVGHPVQAGEPVGVMPGWDPRTPGDRPALYVELRRDGQPINPSSWFKARSQG